MAAKRKFTRISKVSDLAYVGVPTEAIPTYAALADYANNKTALCCPKMETLAKTLGRSVRTVQRHLHLLKECGLIELRDAAKKRLARSYQRRLVRLYAPLVLVGGMDPREELEELEGLSSDLWTIALDWAERRVNGE